MKRKGIRKNKRKIYNELITELKKAFKNKYDDKIDLWERLIDEVEECLTNEPFSEYSYEQAIKASHRIAKLYFNR